MTASPEEAAATSSMVTQHAKESGQKVEEDHASRDEAVEEEEGEAKEVEDKETQQKDETTQEEKDEESGKNEVSDEFLAAMPDLEPNLPGGSEEAECKAEHGSGVALENQKARSKKTKDGAKTKALSQRSNQPPSKVAKFRGQAKAPRSAALVPLGVEAGMQEPVKGLAVAAPLFGAAGSAGTEGQQVGGL